MVDILVLYKTKNHLRCFKLKYGIKVANSFKTKCTIEKADIDKFLVCIDVFDNQDPKLDCKRFHLNSITMLSNTMKIVSDDELKTKLPSSYFADNNLIYFFIEKQENPKLPDALRSQKEVFFDPNNELNFPNTLTESTKEDIAGAELDRDTFFGYLKQENSVIKSEFLSLEESLAKNGFGHIEFYCREFLDFEILWGYLNEENEARSMRFFSHENDSVLAGQHSIISTPMNAVSYKYKKRKELKAPVFSIRVEPEERNINHDFSGNP